MPSAIESLEKQAIVARLRFPLADTEAAVSTSFPKWWV
jgi:hypothetical protein